MVLGAADLGAVGLDVVVFHLVAVEVDSTVDVVLVECTKQITSLSH